MTPRALYVNPGLHRHGGAERCLTALLDGLAGFDIETRVVVFGEGDLATFLRERGHGVAVLSVSDAFRPTARYKGALGVVSSAAAAAPAVPKAIHRIRREIRRFDADIVHTNGNRAHLMAPWLRRKGALTVATLHDLPVTAIEQRVMSLALRRLDAVVANSPMVARLYNAASIPCRVIDNPVEHPIDRDRRAARERLGLPHDAFVIATLSHFHWYKGQLDLVRAMDRLDDGCHLLLAGGTLYGRPSQEYLHRLQQHARASQAAERIHFSGLQDDVSWVYAAADVVAHCSVRPEPFGMAVVEALLTGTPVVSSTAGTPGEMLKDGSTACLYAPGDVAALAQRLGALRADPARREALGRKGQAWAGNRFDPERHARSIRDLYEELLAASPGRLRPRSGATSA